MPRERRDIEKVLDLTARIVFLLGLATLTSAYVLSQVYLRPFTLSAWLSHGLMLFLTAALIVSTKARVTLFLASLPAALCLLCVNAWLEFIYYDAATGQRVLSQLPDGPEVDRRTPWEFLDDRWAAGDDIVIPICFGFVNMVRPGYMMPLSGLPHKKTLLSNELGFYATYFSDRYGFNNPDSIYEAPSDSHTVVLLGDSYTHGFAVKPGDDIAGQLRERGLKTFNLGCGGNGPLAELAAYMEYGRSLRPDTVVLIYYEGNDLSDLAREWDSVLRRYLEDTFSQRLREREVERLSVLSKVADAWPTSGPRGVLHRLVTLRHIRSRLEAIVSPQSFDTEVAQFREVLVTLRSRTERQGASLLVVYLPHGSFIAGDRRDDCLAHPAHCKSAILSLLEELGIRVLDFEKVIGTLDEPFSVFPYRRGREVLGHLNEAGYRILAASIAEELARTDHDRRTNRTPLRPQ